MASYDSLRREEYRELLQKTNNMPKYRKLQISWQKTIELDSNYVGWVVDNVESLDDDTREALAWGVDHL